MFDTLLQLPLFQGLSQEDFTNILAKVKLHFIKHKKGEVIAQAGSPCDRLIFILKGTVSVATPDEDGLYTFTEQNAAPCLLEPYSMFGMYTNYTATYTATDEVHSISIGKSFVLTELAQYEIFRLNYINIISNRAQTLRRRLWRNDSGDLEDRIVAFIASRSEHPTGPKSLKIKMEDLARIVNDTRLNVSKVLNALQDRGMAELHRGEVVIPHLEYLI